VAGVLLAVGMFSGGAPAYAAPKRPTVDPAAIAALEKMAAFLRAQESFEVAGELTTDDVLRTGQKVQVGGTVSLKVRRPDRLRADVASDRKTERLVYDGNLFTVYQPKVGYYAQFAAPPNLRELVDVLEGRYGVDLPLADLFRLGTDEAQLRAIRGATLVGYSTVRGAPCAHYAFHQADVDWQVWIEEGAQPVPRKLVITTTSEKSHPQFTSVMTWTLGAKLDPQVFAFTPPTSARRIDFAVGKAAAPVRRPTRTASRVEGTP
jgi:hypothetical protein